MTEKNRQNGAEGLSSKPDFASCCREMAAAIGDGGTAMERMMSACGAMMQRMTGACGERSDQPAPVSEGPPPADA